MKKKQVNIGLLGFGTVGSGTYQILEMNREKIEKSAGISIKVDKILVNCKTKKREVAVSDDLLTENPDDILKNPDIDLIVEVLGGIHPASDYMEEALRAGKHVVTANKAAVASNWESLMKAASDGHAMLKYEASVAGGVPILNALDTALAGNEFESLSGIVNGTTNYILTQMIDNGLAYEDVLKTAQEKGFAEADPTSDVEGIDAAYKLSILIAAAFGFRVPPMEIPREGITKVSKEDIDFAAASGYKIKLLAAAKKVGSALTAQVKPAFVPTSHPLASVSNEFNALFVTGNAVDDLMFYGKGAGALPTGSAVVGDIIEIAKAVRLDAADAGTTPSLTSELRFAGEGAAKYYVSLNITNYPEVLGKIAALFGSHGISIESIQQCGEPGQPGETGCAVCILRKTGRLELDKALTTIGRHEYIKEIKSVLRIEEA